MPHYAITVPDAHARPRHFHLQAPNADAARREVVFALTGKSRETSAADLARAATADLEEMNGPLFREWVEELSVHIPSLGHAAGVVRFRTQYVGDAESGCAVRVVIVPGSVAEPAIWSARWATAAASPAQALVAHLRRAAAEGTELTKVARLGGGGYLPPTLPIAWLPDALPHVAPRRTPDDALSAP